MTTSMRCMSHIKKCSIALTSSVKKQDTRSSGAQMAQVQERDPEAEKGANEEENVKDVRQTKAKCSRSLSTGTDEEETKKPRIDITSLSQWVLLCLKVQDSL